MKRTLLLSLIGTGAFSAAAQSAFYEPSHLGTILAERNEIAGGSLYSNFQTSVKPFAREWASDVMTRWNHACFPGKRSVFNMKYLRRDNPEFFEGKPDSATGYWAKKLARTPFYRTPGYFLRFQQKDEFDVLINPVIALGQSLYTRESVVSQNTRGVELRARIGGKLAFYTYLTDNQLDLPAAQSDYMVRNGVVPGYGFWKKYKSNGADFFDARGYVAFNAVKNHIRFQLGNDRMFIGSGYRSLIISDFAKDFFHLRINTHFGPFEYQNVFGQLRDFRTLTGDQLLPPKYLAMHRVGVNVTKKLNLGFNEMVIFERGDSNDTRGFEPEYLNPVIFYRAVESNLGSRDNALMALDARWLVIPGISVYGQFVLDEFKLKYLKENNGWWANKYGYQLGAKAVNFLVNLLDVQLEYNRVRPYTYSHSRTSQSYAHYNQPLAHPLGANFSEWVAMVSWQPAKRIFITWQNIYARQGRDSLSGSVSFGGDILRSNQQRKAEFGNSMFQGVSSKVFVSRMRISRMLQHNLFIDGEFLYRKNSVGAGINAVNNTFLSLGIRWNYWQNQRLF